MPWPETDLVWTFCETPQNHLVDFLTPLHKLQSEKGKDYFHRRKICLWNQRHFPAILRFANTYSRRISVVTYIKILSAEHAQKNAHLLHGNRNPSNSFLMVKMASGMDHGRVRPTTTTKNDDFAQHGGHPANTRSCSLGLKHVFDIRRSYV